MDNRQDICALKTAVRKVMRSHFATELFPLLMREDVEQELLLTAWQAQQKNPELRYLHGAIKNRCNKLRDSHFTAYRYPKDTPAVATHAPWVPLHRCEVPARCEIARTEAGIALDSIFRGRVSADEVLSNDRERRLYAAWRKSK